MDAVSLGFATIDLCIKYGKEVYAACQAYKHAEREILESVLGIEGIWLKTRYQIETLRDIWKELDGRMQVYQNSVLAVLEDKLRIAIAVLQGLDADTKTTGALSSLNVLRKNPGGLKRVKYATRTKEKLDAIVRELDEWHRRFDPSWYLLARLPATRTEQVIASKGDQGDREVSLVEQLRLVHRRNLEPVAESDTVFLPKDFVLAGREPISHCSACTATVGSNPQDMVIVDSRYLTEGTRPDSSVKEVRDFARILANVEPVVFSLLVCRGLIQGTREHEYQFIFDIPALFSQPRALRTYLLNSNISHPLDDRFQIAKSMARSVLFLHSSQIVHKNISPETVLLLQDSSTSLNSSFLLGFEKARRDGKLSNKRGDWDWERNLYRHPRRQGEFPDDVYEMRHDVYSLGVCLLELGLGLSFVQYGDLASNGNRDTEPKKATPTTTLPIQEHLCNKDIRARAFAIKRIFLEAAHGQLPGKMGRVYTDIVVSSLTCLDPGNEAFGDETEFMDGDGLLIGVRYIEKILYRIENIKF